MAHDLLTMARNGTTLLPNEARRLAAYCDRLYQEVLELRERLAKREPVDATTR